MVSSFLNFAQPPRAGRFPLLLMAMLWAGGLVDETAGEDGRLLNRTEIVRHGDAALASRRLADAARAYSSALALEADDAECLFKLGMIRLAEGEFAEGLRGYRAALDLRPDWRDLANELAWILATHESAAVRDPESAVELATRLVARFAPATPRYLDTLAAAYAASERYDEAESTIARAIRQLETTDSPSSPSERAQLREYQSHAELYRAHGSLRFSRDRYLYLVVPSAPQVAAVSSPRDWIAAEFPHLTAMETRSQLRRVAWILATHPQSARRSAAWSLAMAEAICRSDTLCNAADLRALSAALAEGEQFDEAMTANDRALRRAEVRGDELSGDIRLARKSLEAGLPLRDAALGDSNIFETACDSPERRSVAVALVMVGKEDLAAASYGSAEKAFEVARRLDPGCRAACIAWGQLQEQQRDLGGAATSYERALRLFGDDPATLVALSKIRSRQRRPEEALSLLLKAHRLKPDWLEAANEIAWISVTEPSLRKANAEPAVRTAEALCQATGFARAEFLDTLAAAYAAVGKIDRAVEMMRRAVSMLDRDAERAKSKEPEGKDASVSAAQASRRQQYETRLQLYELGKAYDGPQQAAWEVGESMIRRGELAKAADVFASTLAADSQRPEMLVALAQVRAMQQKSSDAIELYRAALRLKPDSLSTANELIWLLATQPKPEVEPNDIVRLAEEVNRLSPAPSPLYLDTLAAALATANRFQEAEEAERRAVELLQDAELDDPRAQAAQVRLYRARRRVYQAAESLQIEPQAHLRTGLKLRQLGKLDEAADHFEIFIGQQGAEPIVLALLSAVRSAQGRTEEAARLYREAKRRWPECPEPTPVERTENIAPDVTPE